MATSMKAREERFTRANMSRRVQPGVRPYHRLHALSTPDFRIFESPAKVPVLTLDLADFLAVRRVATHINLS
jgi:hypothetical protein